MKRIFCLFLLSLLLVSCGKWGFSAFQRGVDLMENDPEEAVRLFEQAILDEDNAARAHYYLAVLFEKEPDNMMLAAWHLRQYLQSAKGLSENDAAETEEWLRRLEKKISIAINRRIGENISDETTLRLKLLEEHAVRQKMWIQELTNENIKLRNALAEQQTKE